MKQKCFSRLICITLLLALLASLPLFFSGCEGEATVVSRNISTVADNFGVYRRFVAVNLRTDQILFECIGLISFEDKGERVVLTIKTGPDAYKKHSVSTKEGIFWDVEDLTDNPVDPYKYIVNWQPKMLWPWDLDTNPHNAYEDSIPPDAPEGGTAARIEQEG